uniref:ATP synthase subunit a n=1 Tax=Ismarus sp. ZJUH_2016020 TaxID=2491162 RepID=A0A3S8V0Y3_9HYME|nr:ATP synthase F0 subunit 6 [Ismarus sp. ZJUH_2016020]
MMNNLFSIFDPSTNMYMSLNWMNLQYSILFIPNLFWFIPSRKNILFLMIMKMMIFEFKLLMNKKLNYLNMFVFISLFIMIMINNLISMFPYIFPSNSHLIMSLSYSLTLWMSFMLFGWMKNYNFMFIHLTPQGTPNILMPFMVLIESISNIIRPMTLSIRLSANIIAGHLLMSLISNNGPLIIFMMSIILISLQSILCILELAVSIIQAYVFSILSTLYSSETNYEKI